MKSNDKYSILLSLLVLNWISFWASINLILIFLWNIQNFNIQTSNNILKDKIYKKIYIRNIKNYIKCNFKIIYIMMSSFRLLKSIQSKYSQIFLALNQIKSTTNQISFLIWFNLQFDLILSVHIFTYFLILNFSNWKL